jgi:hypothetical protein
LSSIETMEDLRQFVMEHGLPATEMTLFGVKCPYCGKSDQIKKLESPDDLTDVIETDALAAYSSFFKKKQQPESSIGVCWFCRNCVSFTNAGRVMPPPEDFG